MEQENRKKYNQKLSDENDLRSRDIVKKYMQSQWNVVAYDFLTYEIDLIVKRNDTWVAFVEVEVRFWANELCPFKTIHVAKRKQKFLNQKLPVVFFAVTKSLKYAYWCKAEDITSSPIIEIKNKYVANNEYFYDVPVNKFRLASLE
jgi:Holliday junction resolvase-like predicted endonuclease